MSVVEELKNVVAGAAEAVGPSVVGLGRGWGRGSGVVTAAGVVLTNAHVLRGEEVAVAFADGRTAHGKVAGALRLLADWGARSAGGAEPLTHAVCGTPLEARWWCPACEQTVDDPDAEDEVIHV